MTITSKEAYNIDNYEFINLDQADLYRTLNELLSHRYEYSVIIDQDDIFISSNVIDVRFLVKWYGNKSFTLTVSKADQDPYISTNKILSYHRQNMNFVYDEGVKHLIVVTHKEDLVKDVDRLLREAYYL